jgi:hypothetical protein
MLWALTKSGKLAGIPRGKIRQSLRIAMSG